LDLGEFELNVHHYWISAGGAISRSIASRVIIETFAVGPLACNCTILADEASGEAIVVDGGDGVDEVLRRLQSHNLRATQLLHTHAHIDHIGDVGELRKRAGGRALLHPADLPLYRTLEMQAHWIGLAQAPRIVDLDADLHDGDVITLGDMRIEVLHTPGHTPGSVCFAMHEQSKTSILSGDTLFAGSIGRWDLGGTSMEDIVASIHRKLMDFADETPVVPGHGPFTTIGMERNSNPYLQ
jgi:glyoxylase-like metal-dependent hydrolase (beta-lactamase superfamily II)